jgi:serine/threonine protein kinase
MIEPYVIGERYRIEKRIGQGGIGDVYYGFDIETKAPVAVKALKPHVVAGDPDIVERFRREGEALRELDHPNIVKMLATIEEDGQHYIVMEYVGGGSLRDLLDNEGRLPLERVLHIALDLSDALTRAHRLKIVHRDIKPANVLLAKDGTPRLTDFGAARLQDRTDLTEQGTVIGTIAYLSPEACKGQKLDARNDIWSFGVMLFEMLTGKRPFDEKETPSTIIAIVTKPLPDLVALMPDVPPNLVDLIYNMLEKNPNDRIPSMRQVGAELEAIIRNADTGVREALNLIYRMLEKDRDQPISGVRLVGTKLESMPEQDSATAPPPQSKKQAIDLKQYETARPAVKRAGTTAGSGSNRLLAGALLVAVIVIIVLVVLML